MKLKEVVMKGVSVSRDSNGKVVTVNVIDGCGNCAIYTVAQYEDRGYKPDWRTLPDEKAVK